MNLHKNRRLLLVITFIVTAIAIVLSSSQTNEPSFHGKRLGTLLNEIVDARGEREADSAKNTVQQMGTNAIPYLLRLMRAKDSKTKELAMNLLSKQHVFNFRIENAVRKHLKSALGFESLGGVAGPAIPDLTVMLKDPETASLAGLALIGISDAGVEAVLTGLASTNAVVRRECAGVLGSMGIARFTTPNYLARMGALQRRGRMAVPPLIKLLDDPDELARARAAIALGLLGQQPEVVIPALVTNLHETNSWRIPASAAKALGRFGTNAVSALPELKSVADHKDLRVREAVEGAVRAIETSSEVHPP